MNERIAPKEYYSIGEVCELMELKPHVLRYWESQFPALSPTKNRAGNRVYRRKEIKLIELLRRLLYEEGYTIQGARKRVDELRRGGQLAKTAKMVWDVQTIKDLRKEADSLIRLLDENPVHE